MLTPAQWQTYKDTINSVHDSFNQEVVTWRTLNFGLQRYGEDDKDNVNTTDIGLRCLIAYNIFRTFPMSKETIAGQLDAESMTMILNKKYLSDAGYLSSDGNFQFDPAMDKFFFQGQEYRGSGETPVAQAGDEPLLIYIILKREETQTGATKY